MFNLFVNLMAKFVPLRAPQTVFATSIEFGESTLSLSAKIMDQRNIDQNY